MLKTSKAAIFLRDSKIVYGTYLRFTSMLNPQDTSQLKSFLIFIGYPRSGSSILGSLLDAHENIIISHELNVLRYIQKGFNRKQIFILIKKNSRIFNHTERKSSGYPGLLKNQYNAQARPLKIIGDKKAGTSSSLLASSPELLLQLQNTVKVPVKCIHIVRNPFDMITTQAYGGNEKQLPFNEESITNAIDFCFNKIEAVNALIQENRFDIYTIKHEDLIQNSHTELTKLGEWLNLEFREDYLNDCANILFEEPKKSRARYAWSEDEKNQVQKKVDEIPFLNGYSFSN